ncbi:MAG: restriction endonuclease subunit S [Candidatus Paceibacterota bacterium]|jgi:type I restriction enzyme S subunit
MEHKTFQLQDVLEFQPKSRHKAGDGLITGTYPFFTSSQIQSKWFDRADYTKEAIILGTGGAPSVHYSNAFSTSTDVFILCAKDKKISAEYIHFYLLKNMPLLERGFKGAGLRHISSEYIKKLPVVLPVDKNGEPDPREQERTVALLREAEGLKEKRDMADQKMTEAIPALFNKMFGNPENTMFPTKRLIEIVDPKRPISYGILKPGPDIESGIPYVRVLDIKYSRLHLPYLKKTTPSIAAQYKRSTLTAGDILVTIRGTVGRTCIVPEELIGANITQDTARLAIMSDIQNIYVMEFLNSTWAQNWMSSRMVGQAVKGLNLGALKELPVPIPPTKLQNEFAERVQHLRATQKYQSESHLKIDQLTSSLMSRAFSTSDL